ncbi:capsule biosynthesis protein CapK [Massilia sp. KIM]|uniref:AMP-binding protein n=1 Tax=Massilia sp. KIM TaxID=1955422 RepID=UPI000990293D|nr:AMP-binding protein [Massilia sp. KIM]OON62715.1 capsule biosynthesis protein CapK [Massilia sp. KIM]
MKAASCDGDPLHRERFPTLTPDGQGMLDFMLGHPCAPVYRNKSGNRLLAHEVEALRAYEGEVAAAPVGWLPGRAPAWVPGFIEEVFAQVPHYRALGSPPRSLEDVAPVGRADFAAGIAHFVPDDVPLERMIHFRTTGTTGHPLLLPSHPVVAGRYAAFHKRALRRAGIAPAHGRGQVGVVLLGYQRQCFTYVSVTPTMNEAGLAKLNLHPDDWRDPDDRARYLDALAPEIVSGDPISFAEYLKLPVTHAPRALISVAMTLLPGLRQRLEQRFGCPVLDIYSLNEVGPVGVFDPGLGGHLLLQPRLYVEILDHAGRPVPAGARGEIAVTGGFNFCLPLLRYRTGDHASLGFSDEGPVLLGLSGRRPVRYLARGAWINNIDVTHALLPFPISHFNVHQRADASVVLRLAPAAMAHAGAAVTALERLFGPHSLTVEPLHAEGKTLQYTSDLEGAHS